jgi:hypothetical protein
LKLRFVVILLALVIVSCISEPGLAANPSRPPVIRTPVAPATINSAKPSSQKNRKSNPTTNLKINLPSDEGSGDSPTLATPPVKPIIDPDEVLDENNKVVSLMPHTSIAEFKEESAFRLLVTIHGTAFSAKSEDSFSLEKGSALLCPDHTINVSTPACQLILHEGCVVTVDVTKSTTYIRDFHDRWKGHVVVKTEHAKDINLLPGVELIVTSELEPKTAWANAIRHQIRRRGLEKLVSDKNHTIYKGEFSIPDAMLKSNHFLLLQKTADNNVKGVIDDVTKTAALLHMSDSRGPYNLMQ